MQTKSVQFLGNPITCTTYNSIRCIITDRILYLFLFFSKKSSCKVLFSPDKDHEKDIEISKDLQNKCSLTGNASLSRSGAAGYSRFLVLEVSRRELMGEEVMAKYGRQLAEKVLRLFEETLSQEKFCSLREEWEMSEVEPGDIVHITGMNILHFQL